MWLVEMKVGDDVKEFVGEVIDVVDEGFVFLWFWEECGLLVFKLMEVELFCFGMEIYVKY